MQQVQQKPATQVKPPISSSYFSDPQPATSAISPPLVVNPPSDPSNYQGESSKDWDLELASPKRTVDTKPEKPTGTSCEDLGSGDEGERDFNAEIEAFGLSKDDFS